jgi:hypothetical protein
LFNLFSSNLKELKIIKIGNLKFIKNHKGKKISEINLQNENGFFEFFSNEGVAHDNVLLKWKSVIKTKIKKTSELKTQIQTNNIFDNTYYSKINNIVKQLSSILLNMWIFNIYNIKYDNFIIDMENEGSILLNEYGYILKENNELKNNFEMSEIKKIIKLSNDGESIFKNNLIENVMKYKNPNFLEKLMFCFFNISKCQKYLLKNEDTQCNEEISKYYKNSQQILNLIINENNEIEKRKYYQKPDKSQNGIEKFEIDEYLLRMFNRKLKLEKKINFSSKIETNSEFSFFDDLKKINQSEPDSYLTTKNISKNDFIEILKKLNNFDVNDNILDHDF